VDRRTRCNAHHADVVFERAGDAGNMRAVKIEIPVGTCIRRIGARLALKVDMRVVGQRVENGNAEARAVHRVMQFFGDLDLREIALVGAGIFIVGGRSRQGLKGKDQDRGADDRSIRHRKAPSWTVPRASPRRGSRNVNESVFPYRPVTPVPYPISSGPLTIPLN
jgi:hypothetical protein